MTQKRIRSSRSLRMLVALAAVALLGTSTMAWTLGRNWDDEARARKARYVFMESNNAYGLDGYDDYILLTNRAYALDSNDLDIAAQWGLNMLGNNGADSATQDLAYRYLKERFYNDTSDYITGKILSAQGYQRKDIPEVIRIWQTLSNAYPKMSEPSEKLARLYLISFVMGDSTGFDKAMELYQRMESGSGRSIDLSSQKISAFALRKDTAAIEAEVQQLLEYAPKDTYVALFAGNTYEYLDRNDLALKYYDLAAELDPSNGNAYMSKAQLCYQMGDSLGYDREVFRALQSDNLEVEPKMEILHNYVSELYKDRSQEPRIRQLFGELERLHPGEAEIHNLYAAYLYTLQDYAGAAEELSYSVALLPDEGAWTTWIQMLGLAEKDDKVIEAGLEGMKRFPNQLSLPIYTAQAYRNQGHVEKALQLLDSVVIPADAKANAVSSFISFKGDMYANYGDTIAALRLYDEAIEMNPDNFLALNNAAYFMAQRNIDLEKAEQYISKVMRNINNNPTYVDTYAWVLFKKGEYALAKQYIDMTINLYGTQVDPDTGEEYELELEEPTADIYEHAGDIYFFNQLFHEAKDFWRKALELDPDNELLKRKNKLGTYVAE